jgi:hypothetical protein
MLSDVSCDSEQSPSYDMYGDSDLSQNLDDSVSASETGPVLQVLELANGETIWHVLSATPHIVYLQVSRSIVNDLRSGSTYDGDDMSTFNRQSFASEFSTGSPSASVHEAGGMQLRFKEHKRTSSKSSYSATSQYGSALRKKTVGIPINRPETKVSIEDGKWCTTAYRNFRCFIVHPHRSGDWLNL